MFPGAEGDSFLRVWGTFWWSGGFPYPSLCLLGADGPALSVSVKSSARSWRDPRPRVLGQEDSAVPGQASGLRLGVQPLCAQSLSLASPPAGFLAKEEWGLQNPLFLFWPQPHGCCPSF